MSRLRPHSIALLVTLGTLGHVASSRAEPGPRLASAVSRQHDATALYEQGVAAFGNDQFELAARRFQAADALVPSPVLSFDAARAYDKAGDARRALAHYRAYLRRAPAAENAGQVRERVAALEGKLRAQGVQQLSVRSVPSGAALSVDGSALGVTPWTGELKPGPHQIALSKQGFAGVSSHFTLSSAQALDLDWVLEPAPASGENGAPAASGRDPRVARDRAAPGARASLGTLGWVTLGLGGALWIGAGAFELARRHAESDARSEPVQLDRARALSSMHSDQTTARVLVGVGSALVVGGGVLLLLDARQRSSERSLALGCGPYGCELDLNARF